MKSDRWAFCALLACLSLLPMLYPQAAKMLIWQRDLFSQGQWWRALSAHFIHIDGRHLLFNLLGLFLVCELFWDQLDITDAFVLFMMSALGVSILLWLLQPGLLWYAGLSGVLHGLWAGFAGAGLIRRKSWFFLAALLLLACKLAWMPDGFSPLPVIHVAHLYGACSGLLGLVFIRLKQHMLKLD